MSISKFFQSSNWAGRAFLACLGGQVLDILTSLLANYAPNLQEANPLLADPVTGHFILSLGLLWKCFSLLATFAAGRILRWVAQSQLPEALLYLYVGSTAYIAGVSNLALFLHYMAIPHLNVWTH